MTTRIGLQIPNFTYPDVAPADLFETVARTAVTGEQSGFDTIFVMDHFFQLPMLGPPEHEMFEAYTLLGALGARTSTATLATLVTGVTYRNPALLAKAVTALDVITGGRAMLGIGAAWFDVEHAALGFEFPPLKVRYEHLLDALHITKAMFTQRRSTYAGTHHSITDAWNSPAPIRPDGIPIMVGGSGEKKTFRIAAEHADELNMNASFSDVPRKVAAVQGHLDDLGRDRSSITLSVLGSIVMAPTHDGATAKLAGLLRQRGFSEADADSLVADPARVDALLPRLLWGDPDEVVTQAKQLLADGLDGVVVNMPADGHDPDSVALAGATLQAAFA